MRHNKWRVLALAIAAATTQYAFASEEAERLAQGLEDSSQVNSENLSLVYDAVA